MDKFLFTPRSLLVLRRFDTIRLVTFLQKGSFDRFLRQKHYPKYIIYINYKQNITYCHGNLPLISNNVVPNLDRETLECIFFRQTQFSPAEKNVELSDSA